MRKKNLKRGETETRWQRAVEAMVRKSSSPFLDVSAATRSRMRSVRRQDTAPELRIRKILHSMGYRYRLHRKDLPGSPDIVFPSRKKVVFVHGCFWHGHPKCRRAKLPTKNSLVWREKILHNKERDTENVKKLKKLGWQVLVIWECQIKNESNYLERLTEFLDLDKSR